MDSFSSKALALYMDIRARGKIKRRKKDLEKRIFSFWPFYTLKTGQRYAKLKKWPKITFRGPILVPEVVFWGFWGLVCIEKWSRNFDSGIRSAIFDTLKMSKTGHFGHFGGIKNGTLGAPIKILRTLFNTN